MNAWGAQAAHVTLIPGVGPTRVLGSASLYDFALGASLVLLALAVIKPRRQLDALWRPADLWQRLVRLSHVLAGARRNSRSRFKQRVDLILVQMLGDDADEQPQAPPDAEEESWPSERSTPDSRSARRDQPTGGVGSTKGYQSKHRLTGPRKRSQNPRSAQRHGGPPREPLLPPN